jgi:hypothetical protein
VGGYICVDMGATTPIDDLPGDDFTVWEGDSTPETYQVLVANDWQGPWSTVGNGTGTTSFDLASIGLQSAQFVKISDDGDGDAGALLPGFDLDAITTVHIVPGCGALHLNANILSCDDTVAIALIDADLNTDPQAVDTASVLAVSDSDPEGEVIVLIETGINTSEFAGVCVTHAGSGGTGFVGVSHGDTLTVIYEDANCNEQPQQVIRTALIDCIGPVISDVNITQITPSSATITWTTDEPSDSKVIFGQSIPPEQINYNDDLALIHTVVLQNLDQCTTYYFSVASADSAGNETVDTYSGTYFSLTTWEMITFLNETMDTNPGWAISGGQWAWGQPTGGGSGSLDPTSGYTGNSVYGYNLNGDYANSIPAYYLTTPAFDCSQSSVIILSYWRWLGVESNTWDHAILAISIDNGTSWITVWENADTMADTSWTYCEYDLSEFAAGAPQVMIRWQMGPTDSSVTYCGWNIDDVLVAFSQPCEHQCIHNGDANLDGSITAGDAQLAFSIALGTYTPTFEESCAADCNADAEVTAGDAQGIFGAALGLGVCADPLRKT